MDLVKSPKYIVVVGASAGGLNSVAELIAQLTEEMDLSVFVVLHITHLSLPEILLQRLQSTTKFTCKLAEQGETIKPQTLYLAVPNKHLLVKKDRIILGEGTAENRWRPSIDILFRSAAVAYDGRTIGIILSGLMQDGTTGMQAIQRCGGTTIVQDPSEAEYPDMPLSVMNLIKVDYCVPLNQIGPILLEKSINGIPEGKPIPEELQKEAEIAERVALKIEDVQDIGKRSNYSCPDCGGGLWEIVSGDLVRYRCHTGHVFTENELLLRQSETLENTLWVALRMIEERKNLLDKMSNEEEAKGWIRMASRKKMRASELSEHIEKLKEILFRSKDDPEDIQSNYSRNK